MSGSDRSSRDAASSSRHETLSVAGEVRPEWTGLYDDDGRKRAGDEHAYPNPRPCTLADAGVEIKTGQSSEYAEDVTAYFGRFIAPITHPHGGGACVHCGERYSWTWDICHGEARCTTCGWPVRVYHFIKDRHGADLVTIRGLPLQYPPANAPAWRVADGSASDQDGQLRDEPLSLAGEG